MREQLVRDGEWGGKEVQGIGIVSIDRFTCHAGTKIITEQGKVIVSDNNSSCKLTMGINDQSNTSRMLLYRQNKSRYIKQVDTWKLVEVRKPTWRCLMGEPSYLSSLIKSSIAVVVGL